MFDALNYHLSLGAQAVLNHEGTLDKFMGDAIMAFFNAPLPQPDYALRAVAAAVEMQSRLAARVKTVPLHLRLQFGVGIACGEAVVGNIGTAQLMNYTAIGHSVNLARRLQEAAKGGQILIDENTYQAVQHHVRARALDAIDVKGFSAPVPVYEVLGLRATERDSENPVVVSPLTLSAGMVKLRPLNRGKTRARSSIRQSSCLLSNWFWVRVPAGSPATRPVN